MSSEKGPEVTENAITSRSRVVGAPMPITPTGRIVFEDEERGERQGIVFEDGERPGRRRGSRSSGLGDGMLPMRRSATQESIRSVRERTKSVTGVPIEFRTLSFRVADSQARSLKGDAPKKGHSKGDAAVAQFEKADYHKIELNEVYQKLRTSPAQGLSQDSAARILKEVGENTLPRQPTNYIKKILTYIFGGFCSVLWVGVIIFFICWRPLGDPDPAPYNLGLAILVLIVIFLQALFSAFQDYSTAKTMNSILDMVPSDSMALRGGDYVKVPTPTLVPGDIVRISIGNKVPADLRLIETSGDVRFDRSALTGESEEIDGVLEQTDENFLETKNIALMGTVVTNGSATGVIVFTGTKTVMGGIAKATSSVKDENTALQKEINRFVIIIVGLTFVLAMAILITWLAWLRADHYEYLNVIDMLDDVMGCVVAFIPEGMPVAVALTLLIIAKRMKAANVLPKSLATVETLGCVNVLCSDKTGTLTENKMTVTSVGFVDQAFKADEAMAKMLAGEKVSPALHDLYRAAHLCNDAAFDPLSLSRPINDRLTQGNPTDGAILRFAEAGRPGTAVLEEYRQIAQIPFNSKNKLMLTLNKSTSDEKPPYLAIMKGGPDVLLPKCTSYFSYEEQIVKPLDAKAKADLIALQTRLSNNAERVILICQRLYTPKNEIGSSELPIELLDEAISELTIIGLLGIFDPPRPESAATVAACRRAGIRFFMMTGDFGLTGAAIARQIGIFTGEGKPDTIETVKSKSLSLSPSSSLDEKKQSAPVAHTLEIAQGSSLLLEGAQISSLVDEDWDIVCSYEEIVFGRCVPEHKLRIIDELKRRGYSTAVTGDGVNDAPALKAADVGIAMVNGSDVALEAADLILLGGFDSIVEAVRLGRLVFQNLQKVISYLLPAGSWSEIWPVLLNVFFGVPLPLSSFLMIIICVFTDLFLSLALIMEKEEFDLLSLPPRRVKKDHLINFKIYAQSYLFIGIMETICAHAMFFLYYWRYAGIPISSLWFAFEAYSDGFYGYTADQLNDFNVTGQSVYFVTLVLLQWGNILSIRNKRLSILQADPITKKRRNPYLIPAALISLVIAIFVTEEPGLQSLFGTGSVPIEFWFLPLPLGLGILLMDEIRKLLVRMFPKGPLARIAW